MNEKMSGVHVWYQTTIIISIYQQEKYILYVCKFQNMIGIKKPISIDMSKFGIIFWSTRVNEFFFCLAGGTNKSVGGSL